MLSMRVNTNSVFNYLPSTVNRRVRFLRVRKVAKITTRR